MQDSRKRDEKHRANDDQLTIDVARITQHGQINPRFVIENLVM